MKKTLVWLCGIVLALFALSACGSGNDSDTSQPTGTLPAPQVRVETLPSPTPAPVIPEAKSEVLTPTSVPPTMEIQAWPTLDEEQYFQDQIEGLLNKIETKLDNTDTNIKP